MRHILLLTCCLVVALPALAAAPAVDAVPSSAVEAPAPAVEPLAETTEASPISLELPEPLLASEGVPLWCQQACVGGTAYYLCAGTPKQCYCVCRYPV